GLAYSVYSYLAPLENAGLLLGGVATRNDAIGESIDLIEAQLQRMRTNGPTPEELDGAIRHLTGAYALRFDTSNKIASQLLWIQVEDLGLDYIAKRNDLIRAVTLDDIKRVAGRMLDGGLLVSVAGQPVGLDAAAATQAN
ncbi:MAG: insulinase family protein, partial [Pseudomonadota bacterium]